MKGLRKLMDKWKPNFQKGGKFEKFQAVFDIMDTFLFVPNKVTTKGSHIRDSIDLKRTMTVVILALVPCVLFGMWNIGFQHFLSQGNYDVSFWEIFGYGLFQFLPILVVSYLAGGIVEVIFAQIRGHEVNEGYFVSGMLIPLVVPVDTPLWMVGLAAAFAVLIGKEVFGGTGMNIVNPALLARAFLFFSYPSKMSGDKIWIAGLSEGEKVKGVIADGFSGATPLAQAAAGQPMTDGFGSSLSTIDMFLGYIPGSIGETSTLAILLGAAILLITGIASWRIMLSVVIGGLAMGLIFNAFAVNSFMEIPAYQHLLLGGFAFGAVFMATDPVTATQTQKGKYIYGFLIGFIAVLVRVLNPAYPEGMMLAILLLNVFAPTIDYYVVEGNIKRRLKRAKVSSAK